MLKVTPQDSVIKNPADDKTSPLKSLGHSKLPFQWDRIIRVENEVDGLIVNHIIFTQKKSLFNLKSTEIKVTANIQVTNASSVEKYPSFSIAVFNEGFFSRCGERWDLDQGSELQRDHFFHA